MFSNGNISKSPVLRMGSDNAPSRSPHKLYNVAPVEFYMIEFTDDGGQTQIGVVMRDSSNNWWAPPNYIEWARQTRPMSDWLEKQIKECVATMEAPPVTIPEGDSVSVMDGA